MFFYKMISPTNASAMVRSKTSIGILTSWRWGKRHTIPTFGGFYLFYIKFYNDLHEIRRKLRMGY